jgi:D-beta-D-heptose 7-phosphate kinase/D-beta-D-heptose 1-phosphate adenosyltransferase
VKTDFKILVIGDVILDCYLYGRGKRLCQEAPVPVVVKESQREQLGAAANVAVNLKLAGADPALLTVIGTGPGLSQVKDGLSQFKVDCSLILDEMQDVNRKWRVVADKQLMLRLDSPLKGVIQPRCERELIKDVGNLLPQADAVVISDYNKGVITPGLLDYLNDTLEKKLVVIDPYVGKRYPLYRNRVFVPNEAEFHTLKSSTFPEVCFVTCGRHGMKLKENGGTAFQTPAVTQRPVMVTGAGDVATAYVTLGLLNGMTHEETLKLANVAAGTTVKRAGNCTITLQEAEDAYKALK